MSDMTIITNNVPRIIVDGYELTAVEREQFAYIDWGRIDRGHITASFVRYKGQLHDLGDTMPWSLEGWDGMVSETFFSGVLFRYDRTDNDRIICGRYYS